MRNDIACTLPGRRLQFRNSRNPLESSVYRLFRGADRLRGFSHSQRRLCAFALFAVLFERRLPGTRTKRGSHGKAFAARKASRAAVRSGSERLGVLPAFHTNGVSA